MTTNGVRVCLDRWYVMVIFLCLMQTVPMHFDGLFDCSIGHFNRHSKTSFEKNCFSAWASTLNMGLINKVDMVCLSPVGYGV